MAVTLKYDGSPIFYGQDPSVDAVSNNATAVFDGVLIEKDGEWILSYQPLNKEVLASRGFKVGSALKIAIKLIS